MSVFKTFFNDSKSCNSSGSSSTTKLMVLVKVIEHQLALWLIKTKRRVCEKKEETDKYITISCVNETAR